jgi:hypothetical protein
MTARETYEKGAELTYQIVLAWTHPEGPPLFAFPPKDFAVLADLRDVGEKLARNESARQLLNSLIVQVVGGCGEAPTAMMLRVCLEKAGHPIKWVPLAELQL